MLGLTLGLMLGIPGIHARIYAGIHARIYARMYARMHARIRARVSGDTRVITWLHAANWSPGMEVLAWRSYMAMMHIIAISRNSWDCTSILVIHNNHS